MEIDGAYLIGALMGWVVTILLGWMVGESRGRPGAGFLCAFLLGPLGVIVALFLPREARHNVEQRKPGSPTKRERRLPVKGDPIAEWERRELYKRKRE